MSRLTTYGATNRVIDTALSVRYFKRLVFGTWTAVSGNITTTYTMMHEYHRVATKSYKYVGMDYATAIACAAAMRTAYTRTTRYQQWNGTGTGSWDTIAATGSEIMAEIVPTHNVAGLWDVVVNVSEDDVRMAKTDVPLDYATAFAAERQRTYDGESEAA